MKLLNIVLRGAYILLTWYFSSEDVKKFIAEVEDYQNNRKKSAETEQKNTEDAQKNTEKE